MTTEIPFENTHMQACTHTHIQAYTHTHTSMHTYTHTHLHTPKSNNKQIHNQQQTKEDIRSEFVQIQTSTAMETNEH